MKKTDSREDGELDRTWREKFLDQFSVYKDHIKTRCDEYSEEGDRLSTEIKYNSGDVNFDVDLEEITLLTLLMGSFKGETQKRMFYNLINGGSSMEEACYLTTISARVSEAVQECIDKQAGEQ